ncbi:possible type I restriction-modification system protein [Prevotella sp. CAG:5226]|nr:possible type I restriction-modification system protein [Prevotella sp. CAG:5226]
MIQSVNKYHIYEIFASDGKFYYSIPKYQREYTWNCKEWDALYDDISENNPEYFIGSIICIPLGDSICPYMEVIDGQQRLTTISLFLAAIYTRLREFKNYMDEDDEDILPALRKSLKSSLSPNEMKLVPQVQNNNLEDYNFIMSELGLKKSASTRKPYFVSRKVSRCYQHFLMLMDKEMENMKPGNKVAFLLGKFDKLKQAMLVKMEVSSHSDAYILFESLNNRGTPLTAIDLMKNLIMAKAENNHLTTDDCFNRWQQLLAYLSDDYGTQERFFRQYYNAFKRTLNDPFRSDSDRKKDPLGVVATKSNLLKIFEKLINKDLNLFLTDVIKCGRYYSWLILQEQEDNPYKKHLEDLEHIQGAPSYLLLMYVLKYKTELELADTDINTLIELLNKYFVRRNVTDYPSTRDLTRIFMDIIAHIENEMPKGKEVIKVIVKLLNTANNCATDEMFERSLQGDIYKENVGAARYMLCKLAESAMTQETWTDLWARTPKNVYIWTIEHIFPEGENIPQSWVDMIAGGDTERAKKYLNEYTHKIGNLTITGYNSTLSNKSFLEKRDRQSKDGKRFIGYRNGLDINKEIAELDTWTIEDIKRRSEALIQQLMIMFKFPDI